MVERIPQQDLEALNAYLDGELSAVERTALESRLSQEPALQAELQALQATVGILSELERVPVPRSFTLDPAVYARKPGLLARLGLANAMPLMAGAAAVVVAVICVGAVLLNGGLSGRAAEAIPEIAMQEAAEDSAPAADESFAAEEEMEEEEPAEEEEMEEEPAEEEMVEMEMAEEPAEEESAATGPRPDAGGGGGDGGVGSGGGPDSPGVGGDGPLPEDEFYEVTPDPNANMGDEGDAAADGAAELPPAPESEGGEAAGAVEAQALTDTPDDRDTEQALPLTRSEEPSIEETVTPQTEPTSTGPNLAPVLAIAGIVLTVILIIAVVLLTRRRA